jgi:hypothetical protein
VPAAGFFVPARRPEGRPIKIGGQERPAANGPTLSPGGAVLSQPRPRLRPGTRVHDARASMLTATGPSKPTRAKWTEPSEWAKLLGRARTAGLNAQ